MPTAPINKPTAIQKDGNTAFVQRAKQPYSSASAFKAGQFVVLGSGVLAKVAAGGGTVYGLALEDSVATTVTPPDTLNYGTANFYTNPLDVQDTYFLVNITDGSGTVGSGTTTQAAVSVGTSYQIIYGGTGYTDVQMLNAASSTTPFFKVAALYSKDATADFNGRVICSISATRQ